MKAIATFDITSWDATTYDQPAEGPELSRVTIGKVFQGDLEGESMGEGLFCGMGDPRSGAGYLVSERVTGKLKGRSGTFVLQHGGLMGPGMPPRTFGQVVPGSGTGELAKLVGAVEISRDEQGVHTLTLDYDFG